MHVTIWSPSFHICFLFIGCRLVTTTAEINSPVSPILPLLLAFFQTIDSVTTNVATCSISLLVDILQHVSGVSLACISCTLNTPCCYMIAFSWEFFKIQLPFFRFYMVITTSKPSPELFIPPGIRSWVDYCA